MTTGPVAIAGAFIDAIVWGNHTDVWELLGDDGRETALAVAVRNGMDRVSAGRIRDDVADPVDHDRFLADLVAGLRRDLRSVDIEAVAPGDVDTLEDGTVAVELDAPSLIPGTSRWSAGHIILRDQPGQGWRVDRLEPRIAET